MSQWADRYRVLSREASAEPGRWHTDRAPWQRGIMDACSDPEIKEIWVMKSAQVGWTEIMLNVLAYYMHQDPSPVLWVTETAEKATDFSKDRLASMLRDTPAIRHLVGHRRAKDSSNTLLHKQFPGGHVTLTGANSPVGLSARPIRIVLCDDIDRFPASAGAEGDPISLARKRMTTFGSSLMLAGSTPTERRMSRVEAGWETSDQREWYVPCPHCGHEQPLVWRDKDLDEDDSGLYVPSRWTWIGNANDGVSEVGYTCRECAAIIPEQARHDMVRAGRWVAHQQAPGIAGFHVWEAYSPWASWSDIVLRYLRARSNPEQLAAWVNTTLGLTYEHQGDRIAYARLYERREDYRVPEAVQVVTAGVDVQENRLELELVGWGAGEECWGLGFYRLIGDPEDDQVWRDLDELLQAPVERDDGTLLRVAVTCIDSGFCSNRVYEYVRPRASRHIYAIKGRADEGRPIVTAPVRLKVGERTTKAGRKRRARGVDIWVVGADQSKCTIYGRLKIDEPGPGYCHFPIAYDDEFFRGLTAEKMVKVTGHKRVRREWQVVYRRNEPLDVRCYALAALRIWDPSMRKLHVTGAAPQVVEEKPPESSDKIITRKRKIRYAQPRRNWARDY